MLYGIKDLSDFQLKNTYITNLKIDSKGALCVYFIHPSIRDADDPCVILPTLVESVSRLCEVFEVSDLNDIVDKPCRVISGGEHSTLGFLGFAHLMNDDNIVRFTWWKNDDYREGVADKWKPKGEESKPNIPPPFTPWTITEQMNLLSSTGMVIAKSVAPTLAEWLAKVTDMDSKK